MPLQFFLLKLTERRIVISSVVDVRHIAVVVVTLGLGRWDGVSSGIRVVTCS